MNVYGVAVIPAKMDSVRLPGKNLCKINGKSLVEHSIEYALESKYIKHIIVSTESHEVVQVCKKYKNIINCNRPDHLLKDAGLSDVYFNIFNEQLDAEFVKKITHVVALQPDHPGRTNSLDSMLDYVEEKQYDELITVDPSGERNGSVHIMKIELIMKNKIIPQIGCMLDKCTNIHTKADLKQAIGEMSG